MKPKRDRFLKVAASRVQKALDALDSLSKCSNKANYDYTEAEVRKMERVVKEKLRSTFDKFRSGSAASDDSGFKF